MEVECGDDPADVSCTGAAVVDNEASVKGCDPLPNTADTGPKPRSISEEEIRVLQVG
jgi:hypothetical protein